MRHRRGIVRHDPVQPGRPSRAGRRREAGIYPDHRARRPGGAAQVQTQRLIVEQQHRRRRRVVRGVGARSARRSSIGRRQRLSQHGFDRSAPQLPRPQQGRLRAAAIDDGRFDADIAVTAVQHRQAGAELLLHVSGPGRADAPVTVGAGRSDAGDAQARRQAQQRQGDRVRRQAQGDAALAAGRGRGAARPARHDEGQGAGPESRDEPLRRVAQAGGERLRGLDIGQVDDQRMVLGPALGLEDAGHRRVVVGPRPQAVDGLGGEGHQRTGRQLGRSGLNGERVGARHDGHRQGASERRQAQQRGSLQRHGARRGRVGRGDGQMTHLATTPGLGLAVQVQAHAGQGQDLCPVRRLRGR